MNRRRSNPPIKTATGTQKWVSLRTLVHQLRLLVFGSVAFIFLSMCIPGGKTHD
jgi:hypothetical protein